MSVQLDLVRLLRQRLREVEEEVLEQPDHAVGQGARRGFVVRLDGTEEEGPAGSQSSDSRLLPVAVLAFARTLDDLASLAGVADVVFAELQASGRLVGFPRPTYSESGEDAEKAVLQATWQVPLHYRVSVTNPLVEA